MMSPLRWWIPCSIACLAVTLALGCGRGEDTTTRPDATSTPAAPQKAAPAAPSAAAQEEPDAPVRYEGRTESGGEFKAQFGGEIRLPDAFPDGFPVFPEAVVSGAIEADTTTLVTIETAASPEEILGFYDAELPGAGWSVSEQLDVAGQRVLIAERGSDKVVIQIEKTRDGSRISVTASPTS